jgi:hypothetical protein
VLFGAVAAASPNQADAQADIIYACVNDAFGTIKIVSAVETCGSKWSLLSWNAVGVEGTQGPQGDTGPQGPQGELGPQGPQGEVGPQGPMGLPGGMGFPGLPGAMGPPGPQGNVGPQGAQGLTGPQGATGPMGMPGIGVQGPKGDTGPAGPPGGGGDGAAAMQFVGITTAVFQGHEGPLGYSSACAAEYGPGYRFCTSEEVLNTPDVPATGSGWVRPTFVSYAADGLALEISGIVGEPFHGLTCGAWTSNVFDNALQKSRGLAISLLSGGQKYLHDLPCDWTRGAACCGPPL